MIKKVYCLAVGNGKISAFMPELGANYYASSASIIASVVESSKEYESKTNKFFHDNSFFLLTLRRATIFTLKTTFF